MKNVLVIRLIVFSIPLMSSHIRLMYLVIYIRSLMIWTTIYTDDLNQGLLSLPTIHVIILWDFSILMWSFQNLDFSVLWLSLSLGVLFFSFTWVTCLNGYIKTSLGTSLVVWWLRLHAPGAWVRSLVRE